MTSLTLSGVAENASGLGTFTGSTISDASTIKDALQDLETAVENALKLVLLSLTAPRPLLAMRTLLTM